MSVLKKKKKTIVHLGKYEMILKNKYNRNIN